MAPGARRLHLLSASWHLGYTLPLVVALCCLASGALSVEHTSPRHGKATSLRGREKAPQGHAGSSSPFPSASSGPVSLSSCYEDGTVDRAAFPFCHVLEPGTIQLYWNHNHSATLRPGSGAVDVENTENTSLGNSRGKDTAAASAGNEGSPVITFLVRAKCGAMDWVALGLSAQSMGMVAVDVAMARRDQSGSLVLEDRYSTDYDKPTLDKSQDKHLEWEEWRAGESVLSFGFSMAVHGAARDHEDVSLVAGMDSFVMWAIGSTDNTREPEYHGHLKGSERLPLLATPEYFNAHMRPLAIPDDARVMRLEVKLDIPVAETTYMCLNVEVPRDRKYHIYDIKALGARDVHKRFVHHTIIYNLYSDEPPHKVNEVYNCTEKPQFGRATPFFGTSLGAMITPMPEALALSDAGIPLGKGHAKFWSMELHLTNEDLVEGIHDVLGLEVTYSPTLRKHDLGVLATGAMPSYDGRISPLRVPPAMPSYDYLDYCASTCMNRATDGQPSYVLSTLLHMHSIGAGGELQLLRRSSDGSGAVTPMALYRRDKFDFSQQQVQTYMAPGFPLLPNDSIVSRCTYNSTGRTNETIFGIDTFRAEMCTGFLFYYPAGDPALTCMDLREAGGDPLLDYIRAVNNGTDPPLIFCAKMSVLTRATDDPESFDRAMVEHGMAVAIPEDELGLRDTYKGRTHGPPHDMT